MARHIERFGASYANDLGCIPKVVALDLADQLRVVVIVIELAGTRDKVLAAVLPDEQAAAERAVGQLRAFLAKRGRR